MAKAPNSAIGLDLGRNSVKCVQINRRGENRYAVTHYASYPLTEPVDTPEQLAAAIKPALKEMGRASAFAISISHPQAIIRLIDQPETPTDLLRGVLRINSPILLNQDCRDFVLDCDRVPVGGNEKLEQGKQRYLVGGLPRTEVAKVQHALESNGQSVTSVQLAPISLFNAFEFAQPEVFASGGFFLVDIGFISSTMVLGTKRELVLVRTVDVGGHTIMETLSAMSGESRESVLIALEQQDEMMMDNARVAMMNLTREISSSIGFFEGRREETVTKIHVSGGSAKSGAILRVMSDELHIPCEPWNPFDPCEVSLPSRQRDQFPSDMFDLHVACGAAAELIAR